MVSREERGEESRDLPTDEPLRRDMQRMLGLLEDALEGEGTAVDLESELESVKELQAPFTRYRIETELGRGGMGIVHRVWDENLQRFMAMKRLRPESVRGPSARSLSRFLVEARVTSELDHPGIVPIHDLGLDPAGTVFFTMKLVEGQTLAQVLKLAAAGSEEWSMTRVVSVLQKVCEAVAFAHSRGVVHRDLKPSNVMVGSFGEVYVMDWGVVRLLGDDAEATDDSGQVEDYLHVRPPRGSYVTRAGEILGTPAFMAPEQASGNSADLGATADVYSIGAMLHTLLFGRPPAGQELPAPHSSTLQRKKVIPELEAICLKSIRTNPGERYSNANELGEELRAFLEGKVVGAYKTGALAELKLWVRRNQLASVASFLSVLIFVVASSWIAFFWREAQVAHAASEVLEAGQQQGLGPMEVPETWRHNYIQDVRKFSSTLADVERPDGLLEFQMRLGLLRALMGPAFDEEECRDHLASCRRSLERVPGISADELESFHRLSLLFYIRSGDTPRLLTELESSGNLTCEGVFDAAMDARLYTSSECEMDLYRWILDIGARKESMEGDWPTADFLKASQHLAGMHWMKGDYAEAESRMLWTMQLSDQRDGPDSELSITCLGSLGVIARDAGDLALAESRLSEQFERLVETKRSTQRNRNSRGWLALMLGDVEEANELFGKVLLNPSNDEVVDTEAIEGLGVCYLRSGQPKKASLWLRIALALGRESPHQMRDRRVRIESVLGEALAELNDMENARTLIAGSYREMLELFGPRARLTREARERVQKYFPMELAAEAISAEGE